MILFKLCLRNNSYDKLFIRDITMPTPLVFAARNGELKTVRELLSTCKQDADLIDADFHMALYQAIFNHNNGDYLEIVRELLYHGANPNHVFKGKRTFKECLTPSVTSFTLKDMYPLTAFTLLTTNEDLSSTEKVKLIQLLLEYGAIFPDTSNNYLETLAMHCVHKVYLIMLSSLGSTMFLMGTDKISLENIVVPLVTSTIYELINAHVYYHYTIAPAEKKVTHHPIIHAHSEALKQYPQVIAEVNACFGIASPKKLSILGKMGIFSNVEKTHPLSKVYIPKAVVGIIHEYLTPLGMR
jgi:hypothetical protein